MSSQSSGQARPHLPRAAPGQLPPRQPSRTFSPAHLFLATDGLNSVKGSHDAVKSAAGRSGAQEEVRDVVDLTGGASAGHPRPSDAAVASTSSQPPHSMGTVGQTPGTPSLGSPSTSALHSATAGEKPARRGRPKTQFIDGAEATSAAHTQQNGAAKDQDVQQLPFPPRPGWEGHSREARLQQAVRSVHQARTQRAQGVPGIVNLEPPQDARKYPDGKPADFTPWTGTAAEDHLTDKLIKGGFQSTPLVALHDSNTARPQLWSSLKSKSGLQTLSNMFCSVLERRQQSGKLTAPSTFKPPPRVALTDKARETWLLELANPTVPLRRLSRRIPHGIRGKGLLEECMTKNIPPARAVWLAKCVGANEMRSFKRKGAGTSSTAAAGGEARWVREWTTQVQQFIEGTAGNYGQPNWKPNVQYAIRLATSLYSEHLLDQDQYIEWIIANLHTCVSERLPFWMLLTQIYWKDMTSLRRRGRAVAEAMLSQLNAIDEDDEGESPLAKNLKQGLAILAVRNRSCLILPTSWDRYKATVIQLPKWDDHPALASAIENIARRNDALRTANDAAAGCKGSSRKAVLKALDDTLATLTVPLDLQDLASTCLECGLPLGRMMETVLRWASTKYRSGEYRIYVAVRLFRRWKAADVDTDQAILAFLEQTQTDTTVEQAAAFKIVAELCRSGSFALGGYMQWLIASGAATPSAGTDNAVNSHILLLSQLPAYGLPSHIANLRATLLQATGMHTEAEAVEALKTQLKACVTEPVPTLDVPTESRVRELGLSAKYDLSRWLRQEIVSLSQTISTSGADDKPAEARMSMITVQQFNIARSLLEQAGDFAILADVLGITSTPSDAKVLGAVADTVNLHAKVLAAIGALQPLCKQLVARYGVIRSTEPLERPLVFSLYDLTCLVAAQESQLVQQLKADLARCEESAAVAMCSPASDGMGELMYSGKQDLGVDEEIERILSSGTNIDEPAASRLFARIVGHMATEVRKADKADMYSSAEYISPFAMWLQRLRAFDERVFERLMMEWLAGLLLEQEPGSQMLAFALPTVVGASVADLHKILESAKTMTMKMSKIDKNRASNAALNILLALVPGELEAHRCVEIDHRYRFAIEQKKLQTMFVRDVGVLTETASRAVNERRKEILIKTLCGAGSMSLLRQAALKNVQELASTLRLSTLKGTDSAERATIERVLFELLHPNDTSHDAMDLPKSDRIRRVITEADDFTIPFCQLQIAYLLSATTPETGAGHGVDKSAESALIDAIRDCMDREDSSWAELVSGFGGNVASKVREYAEAQILAACSNFIEQLTQGPSRDPAKDWTAEQAHLQRLRDIVDISVTQADQTAGSMRLLLTVVARMKSLGEALQPVMSLPGSSEKTLEMGNTWLDALLRLCIVHRSALPTLPVGEQTNVVAALSALLLQPALRHSQQTVERLFDFLAVISDTLTPEARASVANSEAHKMSSDPRLTFLFGTASPPDAWLGLVTSMSALSTAATSTPKSSATGAPSPAPQSPAPKQTQAQSPSGAPSPTPTPGIQRQNSQQIIAQAQMLQRQNSQQRLQQSSMQPPSNLPPRPSAPVGRGGLTQYSQAAQQQHLQARQVSQAWPPQQAKAVQGQRSVSMPSAAQSKGQAHDQGQQQTPASTTSAPGPQQAQQKVQYNPPVPFPLRRWEILPDATAASAGPAGAAAAAAAATKGETNDTAISLALFGARRVM